MSGFDVHTDKALKELRARLDQAERERAELHRALRDVLAALGNGSGATPEASVEFMATTWHEVRAVVGELRRERDEARADAAAFRRDFEAELSGARDIREEHGARADETFRQFIGRIVRERDEAGRAFRDIVAVLDRDGGQRQAGETIAGTLERATRLAADLVVGEPARIAAAEMARDVAWVRACDTSIPCEGQHVVSAALGLSTSDAYAVLDAADNTDADIAAAIRAAKGEIR